MKTKEESRVLKEGSNARSGIPYALTEEDLAQVSGGAASGSNENEGMCLPSLCPYANRQDCPMYQQLPQYCVK